MTAIGETGANSGSRWHRWDPRVHVPGTLFNDLYTGAWAQCLAAFEGPNPPIRAIGVTDYYLLDCYVLNALSPIIGGRNVGRKVKEADRAKRTLAYEALRVRLANGTVRKERDDAG